MRKFLIIYFCFMAMCFAAEDFYPFSSGEQRQQFEVLTTGLRCLVCQNQNIAESNAGLAVDLRKQVYEQIQQGKSNQEIIDYLVARYGDYILFSPPLKISTLALWFLPFLLLIMGVGYLLYYIRREHKPC
jgi:cytochrome c-type biogenesis protein CcmH